MKRSMMIAALVCASGLAPISAHAVTRSHASASLHTAGDRADNLAARATFQATLQAAANGRDLAFADAKATLLQSLQTAGKDHAAKRAAYEIYKAAAMQIITAYKQAVVTATASYKAAIAAIKGK